MKKNTFLAIAIVACAAFSCKKDRVCECTTTTTTTTGNVTTDPVNNVTYKEVSGRDAKSLCQKSTYVDVNPSGGTTTFVNDCKLK